jgi:outer membrane protein OmpA-like peptidoglycan-associated protein
MHEDLSKLGDFLVDHPTYKLNISGHTDSQGKEDANLRLSQARADAIKEFLVEQFMIESGRIEAHGYGSSKPILSEKNDQARKLNRRVEFELTK